MRQDLSRYIRNPGEKPGVSGLKAAVTTDSAIVTESMMRVLNAGGNAVDAAIAGALVQPVVEPFMTNHAGLIMFLYYEAATGRYYQLDSLGAHPSGLAPFKPLPPGNGAFSAGPPSGLIPGFMPGLKALYERFATKPWAELAQDAVAWAESGHPVSSFEYSRLVDQEKFTNYFPEGREFYMPNGFFPAVGEIFHTPALLETMKRVSAEGPDYMIQGQWARMFVDKANAMGWPITLAHMTETPPRWVDPIRFGYNEYEVVSLAPPQAQGLFCAVSMGILKHLGIRNMKPGSADHIWAMGHALRQGTRHWEYVQDDQIYGVPADELLDDGYHAHLARMIWSSRPKVDLTEHLRLSGDSPGGFGSSATAVNTASGRPKLMKVDDEHPAGSCEIAVVDAQGNWVQMMNTLQGSGIPGQVVGGVPMVGSHATFGHLQSPMDSTLVKGAKIRNIIGNTFALKDGVPIISAGTPGLPHFTIPQVLSYALDFGYDAQAAVSAPRLLPMTESRGIIIEDRLADGVVEDLHKLGVRVGVLSAYDYHMGSFATIARDIETGTLTATEDPRRCAVADGIPASPSPVTQTA